MSSVKKFILDFKKRSGFLITFSSIFNKIVLALFSIFVVNLITQSHYADVTYVYSWYTILVVFSGIGGSYSLLRYGSLTHSHFDRLKLTKYTLKFGTIYTFPILIVAAICVLILPSFKGLQILGLLMVAALYTFFLNDLIKNYFRIQELNKLFAKNTVVYTIIYFILGVILTYFFQGTGYFLAIGLSPLLTFIFFRFSVIKKWNISSSTNISTPIGYWKYGLHTIIGSFANQLIFSIAPILIPIVHDSRADIAIFKVATIICFNLLTLPGILMQADFTVLSKNSRNKEYLKFYYINYLKTVGLLSLPFFILLYIYSDSIITLLFGIEYLPSSQMNRVFIIATFFTYIFRNPSGNILMCVGKSNWNGYVSYIFCTLYIISSLATYNLLGIYSFVYSLAFTFIISGLVSFILLLYYLKRL